MNVREKAGWLGFGGRGLSGEFLRGAITGASLAVTAGILFLTEMGRPALNDLLRGRGVIGDALALEGEAAARVDHARQLFSEALFLVERHHSSEGLREDVVERMLDAALGELDRYSGFVATERMDTLSEKGAAGERPRIGILGTDIEGEYVIEAIVPGSPAVQADLVPGDRVVEVNGQSLAGLTALEVNEAIADRIAQAPEDPVLLGVRRPGADGLLRVRVWPRPIDQNAVYDLGLTEGVLHLHVARFYDGMSVHVRQAITQRARKRSLKGVIIDVRNDAGGLTTEAVGLSDLFLPRGQVVYRSSGAKVGDRILTTRKAPAFAELPVAILINRYTASSSEIFASAMQATGRAVVVGWPSTGKGSIQRVYPVSGGGVRITVAEYTDPRDRPIEGEGVTPDIALRSQDPGHLPSRFQPDPAREAARHALLKNEIVVQEGD